VASGPHKPPSGRLASRRGASCWRVAAPAAVLIFVSPAQACRLHSIWHYPWKQHCASLYRADVSPSGGKSGMRTEGASPPPAYDIPLPNLKDIDWGKPPDDDTVTRLILRTKMEER
jgi:hypothetical protein